MNSAEYIGKFHFEPEDVTKKHRAQSSWKRIAFVVFEGDVAEYYSWFLRKRYNITLNKPLRGAHISFINDSIMDIGDNIHKWDEVKAKWDGSEARISLELDPRTDAKHWWLNVSEDSRRFLHQVRAEVGLGKPYFGLHLSIGYANDKNIEHSRYIHNLLTSPHGASYY